jgi:hypothetical protein
MATLGIDGSNLVVRLSAVEKIGTLRGASFYVEGPLEQDSYPNKSRPTGLSAGMIRHQSEKRIYSSITQLRPQ